jgi:hypothetical protein
MGAGAKRSDEPRAFARGQLPGDQLPASFSPAPLGDRFGHVTTSRRVATLTRRTGLRASLYMFKTSKGWTCQTMITKYAGAGCNTSPFFRKSARVSPAASAGSVLGCGSGRDCSHRPSASRRQATSAAAVRGQRVHLRLPSVRRSQRLPLCRSRTRRIRSRRSSGVPQGLVAASLLTAQALVVGQHPRLSFAAHLARMLVGRRPLARPRARCCCCYAP